LSLLFIETVRSRRALSEKNFQANMFLITLTVGNSLYFFGRSHEHNIINISVCLLLSLFVLLDLLYANARNESTGRINRTALAALPFLLILIAAYSYSGRAINRFKHQCVHIKTGEFYRA
ncbi:MAG: hypothetical protein Q8N68_03525, partial [bacterium]|nr:hypothetical protein [bacterium]